MKAAPQAGGAVPRQWLRQIDPTSAAYGAHDIHPERLTWILPLYFQGMPRSLKSDIVE
jgi:hypothetical protein